DRSPAFPAFAHALAHCLRRRGHEVTVLDVAEPARDAPSSAEQSAGPPTRHEEAAPSPVTVVGRDVLPDVPPIAPFAAAHTLAHRIHRWLAGQAFDAVHFDARDGLGAVALRAK